MEDKIAVIHAAAASGKPVGFCYERTLPENPSMYDAQVTVSERRQLVPDPDEPIRRNQSGELYVIGDDLARGEPRSFTLSKITEVSVGR